MPNRTAKRGIYSTSYFVWSLDYAKAGQPMDISLNDSKMFLLRSHFILFYKKFNSTLKLNLATEKPYRGSIKWRPPLGELYKTNYDGVVFSESREASIGVVVRDANGEVIAALAEKITYSGLVEMVETLAARRAANFLLNWESPCLNLRVIQRWCARR